MEIWQFFLAIGITCLVLELFAPLTFFLSFSIGAFLTSFISVWVFSPNFLIPIFVILSILSLLMFRPFLAKYKNSKENIDWTQDQYINKKAKVIKPVNKVEGAISIYDERWEARALEDEEIPIGEEVQIIKKENLTMFVKRV